MSLTKRMMEAQEQQLAKAREIAIESGALELCDMHEEPFEGEGDVELAYEYAEPKFDAGDYDEAFESKEQMRQLLEEAITSSPLECPSCERMDD